MRIRCARCSRVATITAIALLIPACTTLERSAGPPATSAAPAAAGSSASPRRDESPSTAAAAPAATARSVRLTFVDAAVSALGQPYRFGGAAPGGFDCSGLVVYAGERAGLRLPRTTREQARAGRAVRRADVQAGDLVFMRLSRRELHVGIALDASRFVHAPATGRTVRIDSIETPPYAHAFVTARRIVDGELVAAAATPDARR